MVFARKVWRLLVGIKDGLSLLFLLVFFAALYAVLTMRPSPGPVREGALLLKLDGRIVEEPAVADPIAQLLATSAPTAEYRARDVVRALRTAARNERVKAVVLDLSRFTGGGLVHMQEIGAALDQVRRAKKPVLTHALAYTDDSLLLAAHASEVWVDPMGGALVFGPGGNQLYYAGLLEKLKVNAHVFRVGSFKSAVEPFVRTDQSPEAEENSRQLYAGLWESWKADVVRARPKANIDLATRDPAAWLRASGGDAARAALAAGLVDKLGTPADFGRRVAQLAGKDEYDKKPGSFAHTSLRAWVAANPANTEGKAIGVVTVAGEIVDGRAGPGSAGGDRIAELLDEALEDNLAALVVRVDSPGGSVTASEQIRRAIDRFRARKIPVVVSMANLAASGGYWVATPAQRVFAEPSTITGSIGVFAVIPTFERSLADVGVTTDGVRTTPLSGQPDLAGGFTPAAEAMIQSNVENTYARFLGLVGRARKKTPQQVDAVAQGRVWDGGTARQLGLVDQFGGLDVALAHAASLAKLDQGEWHAKYLGQEADGFASLLERMQQDEDSAPPSQMRDLAGVLAGQHASLIDRALGDAKRLLQAQGVQAYCLECPRTVRAVVSTGGTLAWLTRLIGRRSPMTHG